MLRPSLLVLGSLFLAAAIQAAPVDFNREIRPLLNSHCFKCHGGVKEAGGLNLQFREQALKAGETGEIAIVPGKPDESAFIARLTSDDPDERMPRKEKPLPQEKIALLRQWIAEGAQWAEHWAYEQPKRSGKSLDALVEARLQREGLTLSPEADLRLLARRIALDVTGLPPEPERVDALVTASAENKDAALRDYLDELLSSPAYGEKWAVPWMDLARYADSKGYESDRFRDMWPYRDWVVNALNADMPYDRFVTEQLAGDLLPNPTEDQIIATGFHRNTPQNDEGGTDNEEFRTYAVLDRLNATFDALQGTSIGCVQCHGHPYDPFVHREYYELLAFFNNTADADRDDQAPTRKVRARADLQTAAELETKIAALRADIDAESRKQADSFENWLAENQPRPLVPLALTHRAIAATAGDYKVRPSGRVLLNGAVPDRTSLTFTAEPDAGRLATIQLELVPDDSLQGKGPGASAGVGNLILTHVSAALLVDNNEVPLTIASARATYEQAGWPVVDALKRGLGVQKEGEGGWAIGGGTARPQIATFMLANPVVVPAGAQFKLVLEFENERWPGHVVGSFRVAIGTGGESSATTLPKEIAAIVAREQKSWKPDERAKVLRHFLATASADAPPLYKAMDEAEAALAKLPLADLPVMQELTGARARVTKVFHRGNWMDQTDVVEPKTPRILNPWPGGAPRNRLGFAQWLTNGQNPLTARVQVNRVWEQIFGVGLVETLEDFGSQGDKPVYQDVLDDLAVRFQTDMRWSQKTLIRELLLSRVYRQSSKITPALQERDPANRLLARGPRFRLTSEQLRDQALALSGILSRKLGGPSVMPYQPPGTWLVPYEGRDWSTSAGEDSRRRALYTFIRRSATYPSMVTFDAPNREFCVVRRTRTNTPLQALDQLNSPVFMEAAAGLAKRMVIAGNLDQQIASGLRIATQRAARDYEIGALRKLYDETSGNLVLVANAILNLDEVQTKN
jgi:hypothetical protein